MQMDHAYLLMRMQRWQGRIASSADQLWPCLSPFLFRSVIETVLQICTHLRRRGLIIRRMLAEYQPRLADYPLEHGYPALPVTYKSFYRFAPLLLHYGGKVMSRLGLSAKNRAGQSQHKPARLRLWQEEEVQELLNPKKSRLGSLLQTPELELFLEKSKTEEVSF